MTARGTSGRCQEEELDMGYRTSRAAREGYVVLEAALALEPGEAA